MKHGPVKVKSRETLTPAQSAQEALDIERERFRSSASLKESDGLEKQEPTPDAVAVLLNEDRRCKANYYRSRRAL
jgi:hypothetical protein